MASRLYFIETEYDSNGDPESAVARSYQLNGSAQVPGDNISIALDTTNPQEIVGADANSTRIVIVEGRKVRYLTHAGVEQGTESWDLPFITRAIIATDDVLIAARLTNPGNTARFGVFNHSGVEQTNSNFVITEEGSQIFINGAARTRNRYVSIDVQGKVRFVTHEGVIQTGEQFSAHLVVGSTFNSVLASHNRLYFIAGRTGRAYDLERARQSDHDITLPAGTYKASFAIFERLSEPDNITAPTITGTSIEYNWDAPSNTGESAITEYQYRQRESGTAWNDWIETNSTDTEITLSSLSKKTSYDFQVQAINDEGVGDESDIFTTSTLATVPGAPTLSVVIDGGDATLTLTRPSDTGGENLIEAEIRYTTGGSAGGTYQGTGSTDLVYSLSDFDAGQQYTFQARWRNSVGSGAASTPVTVTTSEFLPSVPLDLILTVLSDTSVRADWMAPSSDGGSSIQQYRTRHRRGSSVSGSWSNTGNTNTTRTFTGLTRAARRTFAVAAINAEGAGPAATNSIVLSGVPTAGSISSATIYGRRVVLAFTPPSNTPYIDVEVRYAQGSDDPTGEWESLGSTTSTWASPRLEANTQYTFQVRFVNGEGAGDASDGVSATTAESTWENYWLFDELSDLSNNAYASLLVEKDRIFLTLDSNADDYELKAFDRDGNAVSADNQEHGGYANGRIEAIVAYGKNRVLSAYSNANSGVGGRVVMVGDFAEEHARYGAFEPGTDSEGNRLKDIRSIAIIPQGVLISDGGDSALTNATTDAGIYLLSFENVHSSLIADESDNRSQYQSVTIDDGDLELSISRNDLLAANANYVFIYKERRPYTYNIDLQILEDIEIPAIAMEQNEERKDMQVYGDYLYVLTTHRLMRFDLRMAFPPAVKEAIYPQFVVNGGSLELEHFAQNAEDIDWEAEFDNPSYLSIDSDNVLQVSSNAVTEDTTVLLKLTAANDGGTNGFSFYLIIFADTAPVWEDVTIVPMTTLDRLNLFSLVKNADSVDWKSGFTEPTELDISDGTLSFDDVPDESLIQVQLTATNTHGSTDITFNIEVIKTARQIEFSEEYRFRLEVEGIDITDDLIVGDGGEDGEETLFSIEETLDVIRVNVRAVGDCQFTLNNATGKYNSYIDDNFWDINDLNTGGSLSKVKLYVDTLTDGSFKENLLFNGVILDTWKQITEGTIEITCVDASYHIRNAGLGNIGLTKYAHLFRQDDESYEGIYTPEASLLPILEGSGEAVVGDQDITIKSVANQSEGVNQDNTGYLTSSDLRTQGGYLDDRPFLKFRTQHQRKNARFIINALAGAAGFYNAHQNYALPTLDDKAIANTGSIAFNVEATRITRVPVDWIYDETNDRVYILMRNLESHVSDLLVRYDVADDLYSTVYRFPLGLAIHNLASSDFDTFYFMTTEGGYTDGSRVPPLKVEEAHATQFDSTQSDQTKIVRYVVSTSTFTDDFVDSDDSQPPQVATHYFAGFANKHQVHEYEGFVPDNRNPFEIYDSQLYYRYASNTVFGVARVNASGTITALFTETPDKFYNAQKFAFTIASNGDVYFAYVVGEPAESTLTIKKRTSGGTTTTLLTEAIDLHEFTAVDDAGGAFAGIHEIYFFQNHLYLVAEVQHVTGLFPDADSPDISVLCVSSSNDFYFFRADTAEDATASQIRTFEAPVDGGSQRNISRYAIDDTHIYIVLQGSGNLHVISKDTNDGDRATAERVFSPPTGQSVGIIAVDDTNIYAVSNTTTIAPRIFVFSKSTADGATATAGKSIILPIGANGISNILFRRVNDIAIDGNDIYAIRQTSTDRIVVFSKTTNDGDTADITKEFTLGEGAAQAIVIVGSYLYAINGTTVSVYNKNTADGDTANVIREFTSPTSSSDIGELTLDDRYRIYHESAGAVLYRVNTTGTARLAVVDTYDFSHYACRSLVEYDNKLHYLEHPAEAYRFKPINPNLESYQESIEYNLLPENTGALKRLDGSTIVRVGALWYEDVPYFGVQTRCLVFNDQLHVIANYSRMDDLLRPNSNASKPDNAQWLVYGDKLDYILPDIPSTGTIFQALSDIAQNTGTLFSVRQNLIQFQENLPYRAKLSGSVGGNLPYNDVNRAFPDDGYLLINNEILEYTSKTAFAFEGIKRGILNSPQDTHDEESDILYLDNIINASSLRNPYQDISIRLDINRFYNVVRDTNGITEQRDATHIDTYGERIYDLDLGGLTRHEAGWIDFIGNRYLDNLKELRYLVNATLLPSFYLNLGDVISFYHDKSLLIPVRIVSIVYTRESTRIIGRSV